MSTETDNTMRAELLPCPFCGGQPYPCAHKTYQHYGVNCICGASGPAGWAGPNPTSERILQAMSEGIAAWNRRAGQARIVAAETEACAALCGEIGKAHWATYKQGDRPGRADPHYQGLSMGADECEDAIRARLPAARSEKKEGCE